MRPKISKFLLIAAGAILLSACNHLSREAKEIAGNYYLTSISEDEPVMELNTDGSCRIHAIKPGVMSYTVDGTWNVDDNEILIKTDGVPSSVTGDTTVVRVGRIPQEITYKIATFTGHSLTLHRDGNDYLYVRRGHYDSLEDSDKQNRTENEPESEAK